MSKPAESPALLIGLSIGAGTSHWVDSAKVQDGRLGAKGPALCGEFCSWVSKYPWSEGPGCPRCLELGEGRGAVKQGKLL